MKTKFRESYKIEKSPVELSDEIQLGLANNLEYDEITDNICMEIYNYFIREYPNIDIEIPKKRAKSPKSRHEKSKTKEIERLSKLYVLDEITNIQKEELYKHFEDRVNERKDFVDVEKVMQNVKDLLDKKAEELDIETIIQNTAEADITNSVKKNLLRILKTKIQYSKIKNRAKLVEELDKKYGKEAARESGKAEDDIIQYDSIEDIIKNPAKRETLYDAVRYLKSEDLMASRIVITSVPTDVKVDNKLINKVLKKRDEVKDNNDKIKHQDLAMRMIATEFMQKLVNNKEFLNEQGIDIIPFSLKHKHKTNGYVAEHVKFYVKDKPEYTLEIQIKSCYVENLSRGKNSKASHENRPGKERIFPDINDENFKEKIEYTVPKYTIFMKDDAKYTKKKKCNLIENAIGYYENEIDPELYLKVYEKLGEKQNQK